MPTHYPKIIAFASTMLIGAPALAQGTSSHAHTSMMHTFRFQPSGDVVEVTGADFRHAWVRMNGTSSAWGVVPNTQDPLFDPFGEELWSGSPTGMTTLFNTGLGVNPVSCIYSLFNIPPSGILAAPCLVVPLPPSIAAACTDFYVAPYSTSAPFDIQGHIGSSADATALNNSRGASIAYAYASAGIFARGGVLMANGTIDWNPTIDFDSVGSGAHAIDVAFVHDPIQFTATNLDTGEVIEANLLDYALNANGSGSTQWQGGVFSTDLANLDFMMDIPPDHVAPGQSGTMHLRIRNGFVDIADDTGRFDGLLPPVGTSIPLVFPLSDDIDLDYDLGLDQAFPWDVNVELTGGSGVHPIADDGGCQADINGDGVLDFFDVLEFLELFASENPAADFNHDDILDFFDIQAFLEAFASGCEG